MNNLNIAGGLYQTIPNQPLGSLSTAYIPYQQPQPCQQCAFKDGQIAELRAQIAELIEQGKRR